MAIKTVSSDTAIALRRAGFKQDTYRHWVVSPVHGLTNTDTSTKFLKMLGYEMWAAPVTDELLEELPPDVRFRKCLKFYWVSIGEWSGSHESLPEALAAMWLYLNKEGLLCAKE